MVDTGHIDTTANIPRLDVEVSTPESSPVPEDPIRRHAISFQPDSFASTCFAWSFYFDRRMIVL